jgi:uncharacterized protein YunC (DUF1805 family)
MEARVSSDDMVVANIVAVESAAEGTGVCVGQQGADAFKQCV